MASRIPKTFDYPVIYPSGAIIYCDNEEEQKQLQEQINEYKEKM